MSSNWERGRLACIKIMNITQIHNKELNAGEPPALPTATIGARKNLVKPWRFFYGFFNQKAPLVSQKLQLSVNKMLARLEILTKNQHNTINITVTLSARKSNAQPWRFFYARYYRGVSHA